MRIRFELVQTSYGEEILIKTFDQRLYSVTPFELAKALEDLEKNKSELKEAMINKAESYKRLESQS